MSIELLIGNEAGTKVFQPVVEDSVEWSTERRGTPGKLTFKVLQDSLLKITEGCPVRFCENEEKIFFGFIFKQQRTKDSIITMTAYDQLRYLKNKDTRVYENKTASQFIKATANDYQLQTGTIENTKYVIPSRIEENTQCH